MNRLKIIYNLLALHWAARSTITIRMHDQASKPKNMQVVKTILMDFCSKIFHCSDKVAQTSNCKTWKRDRSHIKTSQDWLERSPPDYSPLIMRSAMLPRVSRIPRRTKVSLSTTPIFSMSWIRTSRGSRMISSLTSLSYRQNLQKTPRRKKRWLKRKPSLTRA